MKRCIFLLLYFLFASSGLFAFENNVHYSLHKEVITINSIESGYTSSIYCRGKFTSLLGRETPIRYSELEALGGIHARYQSSRGKYKNLTEDNIHNTAAMGSAFYTGTSQYVLSWPSKGDEELGFLYTYMLNCKELMTLSTLSINDIDPVDTFEYEIRVPKGIMLYFNLPSDVPSVQADSTLGESGTSYHFRACPSSKITLHQGLQTCEFNCYPSRFIRLILVPESYRGKAWAWLNDWFRNILKDNKPPDAESTKTFDGLLEGVSDPDSVASRVFDFVKTRISYIDVENGLGAFKPRDANEVLHTRQGDCKDMANLICETLQARGIEAYRAISSTIAHEVNMDFPCLASGNHMICVAHIKGRWRYLDATDPVCIYGFPSMHIQGRKIFLINEQGGMNATVPVVDAGLNESLCRMNLQIRENALNGLFSYSLQGLSREDERYSKFAHSEADRKNTRLHALETLSHNTLFSNITESENDSTLNFSGMMNVSNELASYDGKNSLQLNFLPFPHKFPRHRDEGTKIITYQTSNNIFECEIALDREVRVIPQEKIHFSKDGFIFDFSIQQKENKSISIRYVYIYNDVQIGEAKMKTYYELNELIEQTLNKVIVYE